MKMYLLEPEVSGGIGENSILLHENGRIKKAIHLHYEFEGWLGDDLITTSPFFLVSEKLVNKIQGANLNGYEFEELEISTSENFKEMYPNRMLPNFKRLIPLGMVESEKKCVMKWTGHDLCLLNNVDLVVSEKALLVLQQCNLKYCDITEMYSRE